MLFVVAVVVVFVQQQEFSFDWTYYPLIRVKKPPGWGRVESKGFSEDGGSKSGFCLVVCVSL